MLLSQPHSVRLSRLRVEPGSHHPAVASGTALIALFFVDKQVARTVIAVSTFSRIDSRLIKIQSELVRLKWMIGFDIAMKVAILTRLFLD
jgi:DNA-binding IclR family transcriptional regulator